MDAQAAPKQSKYQKELAYQQEMLASVKARSGKDALPGLKASPTDKVTGGRTYPAFKLEGDIKSVKAKVYDNVPTPDPAVPAKVSAPTPKYSAPAAATSAAVPQTLAEMLQQ